MLLEVGRRVRVLEPFAADFPGEHEITEVRSYEDGQIAYILGDAGAFAPIYVEAV